MKFLIDIGHPAHVHIFKNFAKEVQSKGHEVYFTCRDKEFEVQLLKSLGFPFSILGRKYKSVWGKLWGLLLFDLKLFFIGLREKPDIFLSHGSFYAAHAAFLLRKVHISLEDTGNPEQVKLFLPFTQVVLSPNGFQHNYGKKHLLYNGFHQLAYLHWARFTPDKSIYSELGLSEGQKYIIVRFVSYNASHDIGYTVLTNEDKLRIIQSIPSDYTIFITSEGVLPPELKNHKLSIKPERIHHAMAFCSLYIGQSATMAAEAGFLGRPSIFIQSENEDLRGVVDHLDVKGVIHVVRYSDHQVDQILEDLKFALRDSSLLKKDFSTSLIDVTEYLTWFALNYPKSFELQLTDPQLPDRFIKPYAVQ